MPRPDRRKLQQRNGSTGRPTGWADRALFESRRAVRAADLSQCRLTACSKRGPEISVSELGLEFTPPALTAGLGESLLK